MYERGYDRKQIVDLLKVIDLMMTLPPPLQLSFEQQLTTYQEEKKMPLLINIERRGIETGKEIGAKETRKQDMIKVLQNRFDHVPETLIKIINQFDDMSILEQLFIASIKINSLSDSQQFIKNL